MNEKISSVMKTIKLLIIEIGAVYSGCQAVYFIFKWLIENYPHLVFWKQIVLFFLLISVLMFLIRRIIAMYDIYFEWKFNKEIKKKYMRASLDYSIFTEKLLLSTGDFRNWIKLVEIDSRKWSKDSKVSTFNLYYWFKLADDGLVDHSLSVNVYSKSKNMTVTHYLNSEYKHFHEGYVESQLTYEDPFFEKQPNWRNAVLAVYKLNEDSLVPPFEIGVVSSIKNKSIIINIKNYVGIHKVEHKNEYYFDGIMLKRDGKSILLDDVI